MELILLLSGWLWLTWWKRVVYRDQPAYPLSGPSSLHESPLYKKSRCGMLVTVNAAPALFPWRVWGFHGAGLGDFAVLLVWVNLGHGEAIGICADTLHSHSNKESQNTPIAIVRPSAHCTQLSDTIYFRDFLQHLTKELLFLFSLSYTAHIITYAIICLSVCLFVIHLFNHVAAVQSIK